MITWVAYQEQNDLAMPIGAIRACKVTHSSTIEDACDSLDIPRPFGIGRTEEEATVNYVESCTSPWDDNAARKAEGKPEGGRPRRSPKNNG